MSKIEKGRHPGKWRYPTRIRDQHEGSPTVEALVRLDMRHTGASTPSSRTQQEKKTHGKKRSRTVHTERGGSYSEYRTAKHSRERERGWGAGVGSESGRGARVREEGQVGREGERTAGRHENQNVGHRASARCQTRPSRANGPTAPYGPPTATDMPPGPTVSHHTPHLIPTDQLPPHLSYAPRHNGPPTTRLTIVNRQPVATVPLYSQRLVVTLQAASRSFSSSIRIIDSGACASFAERYALAIAAKSAAVWSALPES